MRSIVLSIGGSVILSEKGEISFLKELASLLKKISKQYKMFVIVGGGNVARKYIKLGRDLGLDEEVLDSMGIDITRVNAKLLTNILKKSNREIPCTLNDANNVDKPIVVMGGTIPGHSTDMVGAELAEKIGADLFIIATNVDGIYDKDPNKHSDAKQLKQVKIDQLIEIFGTRWTSAGKNIVIDGPALKIIKRAKLTTCVVNGKRLDQLERAITCQPFDGTKIIV
ncbi:MAG: UMP kinase [Thermoplasmatales archaeon]|nr:MAG: UMP kinase [Thermoplasmatales archaeon]